MRVMQIKLERQATDLVCPTKEFSLYWGDNKE